MFLLLPYESIKDIKNTVTKKLNKITSKNKTTKKENVLLTNKNLYITTNGITEDIIKNIIKINIVASNMVF